MKDRMILGGNAVYSMDSRQTGLNNNVIVCGTSGCGKTMSVSEPLLLETYEKSLIATVTKRRLVYKYRKMLEERGYQVLDLNFVHPGESEVCYDPMHYIRSDADITFLAQSIISMKCGKDGHLFNDPYWEHSACSLLSAEIAYVYESTGGKGSFLEVLEMQDELEIRLNVSGTSIRTTLDDRFEEARSRNRLDGSFRMTLSNWDTFYQLPPKTAHSVYISLNTVLNSVFTTELRNMFRGKKKKLNFRTLSYRRTILFVSSSAVNSAIHGFVNLFYTQAFKELFECAEHRADGKLKIPVHVLCDDFAVGGRIRSFPEYISIFREKQISVSLLIQSESQLAGMYGASDATTIINNCDTYLYMGGMDLKTASNISERMNVPLEEVLYMPVGEIVVLRRGGRAFRDTRYDVEKDGRYREVTRAYEEEIGESDHA